MLRLLVALGAIASVLSSVNYGGLDSLTEDLMREMIQRENEPNLSNDYGIPVVIDDVYLPSNDAKVIDPDDYLNDDSLPKFQTTRMLYGIQNGPVIRDQEYLQHSSLIGSQYIQGGAGEGEQALKPDGSLLNLDIVKTNGILPEYCNPPNPCPLGYTAADGCLEEFENTAIFSKKYQEGQDCICDRYHMFSCPPDTPDATAARLVRLFQDRNVDEASLEKLVQKMTENEKHNKIVAKKIPRQEAHGLEKLQHVN